MRAHDNYFILTCTIVSWPLIFIGGAPLYALALISVMALLFGLAQKRDDKTIELRAYATRPISEWPEMSLKRLAFVLYVCEQNNSLPYYEDVMDYVLKTQNSCLSCGTSIELGKRMSPYLPEKDTWIVPQENGYIKYHKGQPDNNVDAYPEWDRKAAQKEPLCY